MSGTLSYVEDSTSSDIPLGLPEILQSLLSYVVPDCKILLCPMRNYFNLGNYNYAILDLAGLYSRNVASFFDPAESAEVFGTNPKKLFVVSFPGVEKGNILLHSVFGHEVGHQVAEKFLSNEDTSGITPKIIGLIDKEKSSNRTLKTAIDGKDPLFRAQFIQNLVSQIFKLRNGLLHELISDLAAVHLLGPAGLISMVEFASSENLDRVPPPNDSHPPWRCRFREAFVEVQYLNYLDTINSISGGALITRAKEATLQLFHRTRELIETDEDKEQMERDHITKIAMTLVEEALPIARDSVRRDLARISYRSDLIQKECSELLTRLSLGVPPNEIVHDGMFSPVDFRSAINAGWFYKLSGFGIQNESNNEAGMDDLARLNRLLQKAIELTTIHREFLQSAAQIR